MAKSPEPPSRDNLRDVTTDSRMFVLSGLAILVGVLSAIVAWILLWLIGTITNLVFYGRLSASLVSPANNHLGYWVLVIPALGGLVIGLMARYGSDRIRGHGIPEALESILLHGSRVKPRVALLKPISAAISIGTGGPFGAEGPIIMTGGAFGSLFAQFFHLSAAERRILLVSGAAGGMAAIFSAPFAATLLAVELLLFEWKPRSLVPVALAAATAAVIRVPLIGQGPVFPVAPHGLVTTPLILGALLVGVIGALCAGAVTQAVYGFEDLFGRLRIHWMWWPAIGGLVVGLGGFVEPRVLGVGYDTISLLLTGQLLGTLALGILIGKALVWSFSLGSGTSGGVLAPLLMIGAAMGVLLAAYVPLADASAFAILGMAAVMAAAMRLPFTGAIFAVELTHDWNLLLPLLVACVVAHGVSAVLLRRSILTEKLARRGHHVSQEYAVDPLEMLRVAEVMTRDVLVLSADAPPSQAVDSLRDAPQRDGTLRRPQGLPVVEASGHVVGLITRKDALAWTSAHGADAGGATVRNLISRPVVTIEAGATALAAANLMAERGVGRLPVLDEEGRLVGIVSRSDLVGSRTRRILEETDRTRPFSRDVRVWFGRKPKTTANAEAPPQLAVR
ncbi:MAG: chloride channel protein [Thermoplasmatota archaeon]